MSINYEKLKLTLVMLLGFILEVLPIWNNIPLHTSTDELGAIVGAARLAGLDWSGVIGNSGYYGFGWYSLFFWVFKLTDNPILIYRVITILTAMLRVMIIPIAFHIAKNYLQIKSEIMLYSSALLMPFLYSLSTGKISNEYILELLIWLSLFFICKIVDRDRDSKPVLGYLILLILCCAYSLSIHTRALTILIAIVITFLGYSIIMKKPVLFGTILVCIVAGYILVKSAVSIYQNMIYGVSGGEIINGSVSFNTNFHILEYKVWSVWLHMLIGMIDTEIVLTGGLLLISLVSFFHYLLMLLKNRESGNVFCNLILSVSVLCIGATIFAFLLSGWFTGMLSVWGDGTTYNSYVYKGLTYVRYWNVYMPPFVLCSIAIFEKSDYKKIISVTAIALILLHCSYLKYIVPIIKENIDAASIFYGLMGSKWRDPIGSVFYYKAVLLSMSAFIVVSLMVYSNKARWAVFIIALFMSMQHVSAIRICDLDVKERMSTKIMASYDKKCQLEQDGTIIDEVYVYDDSEVNHNWKLYSIAQFYFNRYTIQMGIPDILNENDILICLGRRTEIEDRFVGVNCYVLDEDETWYTYLQLDGEE